MYYFDQKYSIPVNTISNPSFLYSYTGNSIGPFQLPTTNFNINVKFFLPSPESNIIIIQQSTIKNNKLLIEQKVIHLTLNNQIIQTYIFNQQEKILNMGIVRQKYLYILYKQVNLQKKQVHYKILQWDLYKYAKSKLSFVCIQNSQNSQLTAIFYDNSFCVLQYLVTKNDHNIQQINRGWNYKNMSEIKIHYFQILNSEPNSAKLFQTIYQINYLQTEQIIKVNNVSKIGFIVRSANKQSIAPNQISFKIYFLLFDLKLGNIKQNRNIKQIIQINTHQLQSYEITNIHNRITNAQIHQIFQVNPYQFYLKYFSKEKKGNKQFYSYLWFPKQEENNAKLMLLTNENHQIQFCNKYRNIFGTQLLNYKQSLQSLYSNDDFYNSYNDGEVVTYIINQQNYTLHGQIIKNNKALHSFANSRLVSTKQKIIRMYNEGNIRQIRQLNGPNKMTLNFYNFVPAEYFNGRNIIPIFLLLQIHKIFNEDLLYEVHQMLDKKQRFITS